MKLWVDDIRPAPPWYDFWAKTAEDAISVLEAGYVTHISLDHDLGDNKDGIYIANWIEEQVHNNANFKVPHVQLHTANPVGNRNMKTALENYTDVTSIDFFTIIGTQKDLFGSGSYHPYFD